MAALEKPSEATIDDANKPTTNHERQELYSVFSPPRQAYLTYLLGFTMILSTLTATIYFPLIPMLSKQFHVSIQAINLTITVYAIVQAFLGLALNKDNYAALLALRALQGVGGSAIPTLAYGIAADVVPTAERGRMLGPMLSTCNAISAVGPVIGGAVTLGTSGVEWVFWALLFISSFCFIVAGFTLPETAQCVVGNGSKAAGGIWRTWSSLIRGGKARETDSLSGAICAEIRTKERWRAHTAFASLRIILYKDAFAVLWMVALTYSVYYTFQVAIPLEIGLVFLPGLAGMTISGIIAGKLVDVNYAVVARKHNLSRENNQHDLGDFPIESARYRNCLAFVICETILVIGNGWAIHYHLHPSVPIILQFFICAASTLLSHTASALLVDIFPEKSSTAYASGQIMRCGVSAASAAVLQPLVNALGYGWYFTVFAAFVRICGAISVFISRLKGMQWRQKRRSR
ncbi:MFS general substrate transporter [Hypoxylon sp. FL0890]|nr:MFS general substrate transporter [Hypoxylon sp. FL0890]